MKNIKTFSLLFAAAIITTFTSCDKLEDLLKIPITITDEFTVPAGSGLGVLLEPLTGDAETNIEESLSSNDSRKDKIKTIELRELTLNIKTSGEDFSFVDDIEIYLNAEGQTEKLIAWKNDISASSSSVTLDNISDDLAAYIKADKVSFRAKFENKELVLSNIRVEVVSKFWITADIF